MKARLTAFSESGLSVLTITGYAVSAKKRLIRNTAGNKYRHAMTSKAASDRGGFFMTIDVAG
jgi:hypothetical protein